MIAIGILIGLFLLCWVIDILIREADHHNKVDDSNRWEIY